MAFKIIATMTLLTIVVFGLAVMATADMGNYGTLSRHAVTHTRL